MKNRTAGWVVALALILPALPAVAQAVDPVQTLTREMRSLRKEAQNLRRDLARARTEAGEARKQAQGTEARLQEEAARQQEQLRQLRGQATALTVAVVVLGGLALAAVLLAISRRPAPAEGGLSEARARISRLRAELVADEARLAVLQRRDPPPAG